MFEKVNPMHPDKLADRIAGALVQRQFRQRAINGTRPTLLIKLQPVQRKAQNRSTVQYVMI